MLEYIIDTPTDVPFFVRKKLSSGLCVHIYERLFTSWLHFSLRKIYRLKEYRSFACRWIIPAPQDWNSLLCNQSRQLQKQLQAATLSSEYFRSFLVLFKSFLAHPCYDFQTCCDWNIKFWMLEFLPNFLWGWSRALPVLQCVCNGRWSTLLDSYSSGCRSRRATQTESTLKSQLAKDYFPNVTQHSTIFSLHKSQFCLSQKSHLADTLKRFCIEGLKCLKVR